jgi:hypothetical protein
LFKSGLDWSRTLGLYCGRDRASPQIIEERPLVVLNAALLREWSVAHVNCRQEIVWCSLIASAGELIEGTVNGLGLRTTFDEWVQVVSMNGLLMLGLATLGAR